MALKLSVWLQSGTMIFPGLISKTLEPFQSGLSKEKGDGLRSLLRPSDYVTRKYSIRSWSWHFFLEALQHILEFQNLLSQIYSPVITTFAHNSNTIWSADTGPLKNTLCWNKHPL